MKSIQIFYFDAGGGHRAAAKSLKLMIEQEQRPWSVELVNLQELLLPADLVHSTIGVSVQEIYNKLLKSGRTGWMGPLKRVLHGGLDFMRPTHIRLLRSFWRQKPADLVVSVVPNLNATLYRALRQECPGVPYVTILTDLADYPPHFWLEHQDQYVICGTSRAVEQALEAGIAENRIFRVSGMILHPRFYQSSAEERDKERVDLAPEFDCTAPTGLALFGSEGLPVMLRIAKELNKVESDFQMFFLTGRNEKLHADLMRISTRYKKHVEPFTDEVPRYMKASDFMIGKPGPGSISEALQMKLPVIVDCNRKTMIQERYNAQWIREMEVGIVVTNFREVASAVQRMLGEEGKKLTAKVNGISNRAVFEIPPILEEILARGMN